MNIEALKKMSSSSEKKAAFDVDWSKIKGNVNWDAIKQKLTDAKRWYEGQSPEMRTLIGAGVGLGGGALIGKLMGRTGTGALVGTLAGAGTGAYWKHIKEILETAKPTIDDASKKTVGKLKAYARKVQRSVGKGTDGEKAPDTEADALAASQAAAGVGNDAPSPETIDQFLENWNRRKAQGAL